MAYNSQMEKDEALEEFVQILGRIKDLLGEATTSDDADLDLAETIEQLRLSGKNDDADALAALIERAEELKEQHQARSS